MKRKLLVIFLALVLVGCKSHQYISNTKEIYKEESKDKVENHILYNSNVDLKIVEYDTIYLSIKDTIVQPIKKVIYLNKKEDIEDNTVREKDIVVKGDIQEEIKDTVKPSYKGYLISFLAGVISVILFIVLWKVVKIYLMR